MARAPCPVRLFQVVWHDGTCPRDSACRAAAGVDSTVTRLPILYLRAGAGAPRCPCIVARVHFLLTADRLRPCGRPSRSRRGRWRRSPPLDAHHHLGLLGTGRACRRDEWPGSSAPSLIVSVTGSPCSSSSLDGSYMPLSLVYRSPADPRGVSSSDRRIVDRSRAPTRRPASVQALARGQRRGVRWRYHRAEVVAIAAPCR